MSLCSAHFATSSSIQPSLFFASTLTSPVQCSSSTMLLCPFFAAHVNTVHLLLIFVSTVMSCLARSFSLIFPYSLCPANSNSLSPLPFLALKLTTPDSRNISMMPPWPTVDANSKDISKMVITYCIHVTLPGAQQQLNCACVTIVSRQHQRCEPVVLSCATSIFPTPGSSLTVSLQP